jgi:dienelactone hydrolase
VSQTGREQRVRVEPDLQYEWVHLSYEEPTSFTETYGFAGTQGAVNLEGILIRPRHTSSSTLFVMMHPSSTLQLLPLPRALALAGGHVLCAASRYPRNDSACILEKVLLDLGAYIRHAKEIWGYQRIVLLGWSGGGSLALFYQSQAEHPSLTCTPAGDPVDLVAARLIPADAVIFQAAHISRAQMLSEMIDPSVRHEDDPDDRDQALDLYCSANPHQPPYSPDFMVGFRAAQVARVRRITAWVKQELAEMSSRPGEFERGFVTHRTLADPRFLDGTLDPNDRKVGTCYLGDPAAVNNGPAGLARFSTLRSWLSQWSIDDTNANGLSTAPKVTVPFLAIENSADDAVPQPHVRAVFDVVGSKDRQYTVIHGASHYYAGQSDKLAEATELIGSWLRDRG